MSSRDLLLPVQTPSDECRPALVPMRKVCNARGDRVSASVVPTAGRCTKSLFGNYLSGQL
jgi:hypothetical protein